jgi:hypothetical protein
MKEQKTYQVDHPTIKEITVGDQFTLYNGHIVEFLGYSEEYVYEYAFEVLGKKNGFNNKLIHSYTSLLQYVEGHTENPNNIKCRNVTLSDKLSVL